MGEKGISTAGRIGLLLAPAILGFVLCSEPPAGMQVAAWRTAGVVAAMAILWMTEAIPIPVTALLPLVLFPLLGVAPIQGAAAPYANPVIYLFLGGFILALGLQRWRLHERVAYTKRQKVLYYTSRLSGYIKGGWPDDYLSWESGGSRN